MHFLVPAFLAGLAAIAVPIAVHLIGRQKARTVPFAAVDFLLVSRKRTAQRLRLRRRVLLALRVAAVAAVTLVLAKPYREAPGTAADVSLGPQSAVLVLDTSLAMQYRLDGTSLMARAQRRAAEILTEIAPESEVAVVTTAQGTAPPLAELTSDRGRILRAVEDTRVTYRDDDVRGALARAVQILATAPHAERDVYLLSFLPAHAVTDDAVAEIGRASAGIGPGGRPPALHLVDVAEGAPLPNLAVVAARAEPAPELGSRGVRVIARVANFSDAAVSEALLALDLAPAGAAAGGPTPAGGAVATSIARGYVDVGGHATAEKRFTFSLPVGPAAFAAELSLPGDALAADDHRYLRILARRQVRTLVVDGDPRTERREDEVFYLTAALAPGDEAELAPTVVTADDLPSQKLDGYDVVILANVKALPADRVAALDAWVQDGGGLLVTGGDNVDPDAYNQAFAALLPQPLGPVHSVSGAGAQGPEAEGAEHLGRIDLHDDIFSVFPADAGSLRSAQFQRYLLLTPQPDEGDARRTLAWYDSGAPAVVESRHGKGKVLLFTSTIDRDWCDFPIRPGYLPFVQQVVRTLAHAPLVDPEPPARVGSPHEMALAGGEVALEVTPPIGRPVDFPRADLVGHKSVIFKDTDVPGVYRVAARGPTDAELRDRPGDLFVVDPDPAESDTSRTQLASASEAQSGVAATVKPPPRRVPLWSGIAAILLLFLLGEGFLTRRT